MKTNSVLFLMLFIGPIGLMGQTSGTFEENQLYIKFKGNSYANQTNWSGFSPVVVSILRKHSLWGFKKTFTLKAESLENIYSLTFSTNQQAQDALNDLSTLPELDYVERVPIYEASLVPNDPMLVQQWYIGPNYINAYTAWNLSQGSNTVKLAIVDDAVKITHQDLAPNLWVNPGETAGNGIDDDNNGYIDDINGWDAGNNDNNPNPPATATNSIFTHGTHCAGIADARTNNAIGIASIGFGVKLVAVKCNYDNNTSRYLDNVLGGVQYAIAARADVVSMSWGGAGYSQTFQNLFNYGYSLGITFVAAAGNSNTSQIHYPAGYNFVISVAASDIGDVKAGFSNYGNWVDITAPGVNIFSTLAGSTSSYGNMSGTSMACPMVAGLCALMKSYIPALTPDLIEQCLKAGADNISAPNPNYIGQLGAGRINAYNALRCVPCLANASFTISPQQLSNYLNGSNLTFTSTGIGTAHKWFLNNVYQSTGSTFNYTFNTIGYKTITQVSLDPDSSCTDTVSLSFTIVDSITTICKPMYGANWYFGQNCKVTFLTNPPSVYNGSLNTGEGSATISDECGNLLFYTDGSKVWDKNNVQMPNGSGLFSNSTSTQAATIVRKPGSSYLYYIFTVDWVGGTLGLRYSIVDMSLPGNGTTLNPRGDVTVKNVLLNASCTEKITATRHGNGVDFWVVSHNANTQDFYAYLVTSVGVSLTPVTTTINNSFWPTGQMKFSPDGNKFLIAAWTATPNNFSLYDFNKWTGVFALSMNFAIPPTNGAAYGAEFSPDGTKLYMTIIQYSPKLIQYDLTTGIQTTLSTGVHCGSGLYTFGGLQVAPNGKIYVAREYCTTIGVIHNPNAPGLSCNYCEGNCGSYSGLALAAGTTSQLGLPSFFAVDNPPQNFTYEDTCVNQLTKFYGTDFVFCSVDNSYLWNFGDPNSGSSNSSILRNPTHQFARSGAYLVSMTIYNDCDTVTVSKQVPIICCSTPDNFKARIKLCLGDTTQLLVAPSDAIINWSPTAGLSSPTIYNPLCFTQVSRRYTVSINDTGTGCSNADTFYVDVHTRQPINISESKNGCVGDTLRIAGNFGLVNWSNGAVGNTNIVSTPGIYHVETTDTNGCIGRDTVNVTLGNLQMHINGKDSICSGSFATLFVTDTFDTYFWWNGETDSSIASSLVGNNWLRVTKNGCTQTDTFRVALSTTDVSVSTSSTNSGCTSTGSATAIASGGNGSYNYEWSNGGTNSVISNISGGTYRVTVTSGSCTATASVAVGTTGGITLSTSSGNTTCGSNNGTATVSLITGTLPCIYHWSNGGDTSTISNLSGGTYIVTVTDNNGCSATASATVDTSAVNPVVITPDKTIMCSGDSAAICAPSGYTAYLWNTGQNTRCIKAMLAGNYYATVTDNAACQMQSNHISISVYPLPPVSISVNGDTLTAYNAVTYQWYMNGVIIPGATSNVYIARQAGDYTVAVTDSNDCQATSTKVSIVTGMNDLNQESEVKIYPNPNSVGSWHLIVGDPLVGGEVEVFDMAGRLVLKSGIRTKESQIDFEAESGVYLIRLSSPKTNTCRKLVKI